jgi:hypothetical protein
MCTMSSAKPTPPPDHLCLSVSEQNHFGQCNSVAKILKTDSRHWKWPVETKRTGLLLFFGGGRVVSRGCKWKCPVTQLYSSEECMDVFSFAVGWRVSNWIFKSLQTCWAPVAHAYNPSYTKGRDKEDRGLNSTLGK